MLDIPVLIIMDVNHTASVALGKLHCFLFLVIYIRHLCPVRELLQRSAVLLIKEVFYRHDLPWVLHLLQFSLRGITVTKSSPVWKCGFLQKFSLIPVCHASSRMVFYTLQHALCVIEKGKEFPCFLLDLHQTKRCFLFISKRDTAARKGLGFQAFPFFVKVVCFLISCTVSISVFLFFQSTFAGKQGKVTVFFPEEPLLFSILPKKHCLPVCKLQMHLIIMVPVFSKHAPVCIDGIIKTAESKRLPSADFQICPVIDKVSRA